MNTISKLIATSLTGLAILATSSTARAEAYYDKAKVLDVDPIYETVEVSHPEKECWNERVIHRAPGYRSHTGTIVGGVVGGVLGHQIGHGRGRTVATVAGTLLGASIGRDLTHPGPARVYASRERHCEVVDRYETEERLVGYRVEYKYKGSTYVTRTTEHPGKWIDVQVSVDPVEAL